MYSFRKMGIISWYITSTQKRFSTSNYYINTDEIPGELSRENMISSHVKRTCYFHVAMATQ